MSVGTLASLFEIDGIDWTVLQTDMRDKDRAAITAFENVHLPEKPLRDFADTADLLAELDLIVTIDTSVAHLAGAMGRPVWIMLPRGPDWRWGPDGSTTPWYPGARLFRQTEAGNWATVVAEVSAALREGMA